MRTDLLRKVIIENGALGSIKDFCKEWGTPLVVVDPTTKNIAGDKIAGDLNAEIFVIKEASLDEVEKVKKIASDSRCIISAGGGRAIDVGKFAAHKLGVPFISVPTALSHDGIASRNVSLMTKGVYGSYPASTPYGLVVDLDIVKKAPYRMTAAGAADMITNYTALEDWKLAGDRDKYIEYIAGLSLLAADLVANNVDCIRALEDVGFENLVWALVISATSMTIAGSSRPASGAEHMFSHALDSLGAKALHGEQVGLGSIIFSYLQGGDWKRIKELLKRVGAPTTAKEIGIEKEKIIEALLKAKDVRKRYTILDIKPLTAEKAENICKETGVI